MPAKVRPTFVGTRKQLWTWLVSLIGGVVLLVIAGRRIELWPGDLTIVHMHWLWVAVALHIPYSLVRALRLRYALDPLVAEHSGQAQARVPRALLYGSGWVSFLTILLLPLRLGELSRPLMLARPGLPGLGLAEVTAAIATERIVDGLLVVAMLFVGLFFGPQLAPAVAEHLAGIRAFGGWMALVFGAGLGGLVWLAWAPGWWREVTVKVLGQRVGAIVHRVARALHPLTRPRFGLPFLAWSLVYWGIVIAQLTAVLHACGLTELGPIAAATIVATIGLSIQLPGGPAQAGSFQLGAAVGLELYLQPDLVAGPGSSFTAVMYVLGLAGTGAMALVGAAWLARASFEQPPSRGPASG